MIRCKLLAQHSASLPLSFCMYTYTAASIVYDIVILCARAQLTCLCRHMHAIAIAILNPSAPRYVHSLSQA